MREGRADKRGRLSKAELAQDDRPYIKAAEKFMETIGRHYEEYRRKLMKMYQLREESTEDLDDVINNTVILCYDSISRNGIKDNTEQGRLNYFFRALRQNKNVISTYEKRKDVNADAYVLGDIEDESNQEIQLKKDFYINKIFEIVENNFDEDTFNIFKYKIINEVTYKQLRDIYPDVDKQKLRISEVKNYLKSIDISTFEESWDEYQRNLDMML